MNTKTKWRLRGIGALVGAAFLFNSYFIPDTIDTKITDAQLVKTDDVYMIATEYAPLQNHDARYRLKFNSGTIQNEAIRLKLKGDEVRIHKYGWRIPLFSMYENVTAIDTLPGSQK